MRHLVVFDGWLADAYIYGLSHSVAGQPAPASIPTDGRGGRGGVRFVDTICSGCIIGTDAHTIVRLFQAARGRSELSRVAPAREIEPYFSAAIKALTSFGSPVSPNLPLSLALPVTS